MEAILRVPVDLEVGDGKLRQGEEFSRKEEQLRRALVGTRLPLWPAGLSSAAELYRTLRTPQDCRAGATDLGTTFGGSQE